jgi:hypothetical protein
VGDPEALGPSAALPVPPPNEEKPAVPVDDAELLQPAKLNNAATKSIVRIRLAPS